MLVDAAIIRARPSANELDIFSPRNSAPVTAAVTGSNMLRIDDTGAPSFLVPSEKNEAGIAEETSTIPSIGMNASADMVGWPFSMAVRTAIRRKKNPDESDR